MKKLKIAIFTPYNIFKSGGVQEHVNNQAKILRDRGHSVTILTPRPRRKLVKDEPRGVRFLGISARIKAPHATSADVSATVDNEAIDRALADDYDIVHVHEPLVPIAARQLLTAAEGRALRVGTFHAALPGNRLGKSLISTYKTYARSVMPHLDSLTAVSPAAVGYIKKYADADINYIPNGINLKTYKPQHLERDPNMILFIGRLEKRKGARQLLEAFSVLKQRKPEAKLVIVGDGPLRKSLRQMVETYGLQDVEFLGFIEDEQKIKLLSTCGVYTSPALYGESFGIVLVEAMAMGAPTVAHHNDGYSWVLKETGRISLVDCQNPSEYANRLQLMMEDPALRKVWQAWAKKYVKQFDYKRIVDSYEKVYAEGLQAAAEES